MAQSKHRKEFRKFRDVKYYSDSQEETFEILPFNFERLKNGKEVLINMFGEFIISPNGTTETILKRNSSLIEPELYKDLVAKNFVHSSKNIKHIEFLANKYRTKKSYVLGFTKLHMFVITLRCEHTCQYCQVSRVSTNKDKFDFHRDKLIKAIELMLACPDEDLTMEFQGGESLLAFDNLKFAVEYTIPRAKEKGKIIQYVICTNLALVTEEMLEYCKYRSILISTSLDGPEYLHNFNRKRPGKNSHQLLEIGINLVKDKLGSDKLSALMTTSAESLKYPIEIIDEYRRFGFKNVFLRPISPYGFAIYNKNSHYLTEDFLTFYKKGLNYILELNKKGEWFKETYTSIILKRIYTAFSDGYVDLMSPAGHLSNAIIYDYDGRIFVSDEARMLSQMKDDKFLLGTVENSWEELLSSPVVEEIGNNGINDFLAGCDSCALNPICGSDPVHHHATQGDIYGNRVSSSFCNRNKGVMNIIFELIDEDPENEKIFKSWISNG